MDLSSLVIGLLLISLIIVPIVVVEQQKKARAKKFLAEFLKLAETRQLKITESDKWSDYAIGLDPAAKKLFYLKNSKSQQLELVIDLSKIRSCKTVNISRATADNRKVIDRLALALIHQNQHEKELELEFFNSREHLSLTDELPLLEKWQKLISSHITGSSAGVSPTAGSSAVPRK